MRRPHLSRRAGYTLIEMIVSVSIVSIVIGIALPAVQRAREASRKVRCTDNLKQIGLALANYSSTYNSFPLILDGLYTSTTSSQWTGYGCSSVFVGLLPYLDASTVYDSINHNLPSAHDVIAGYPYQSLPHPSNETAARTTIATYLCPSDPQAPVITWAGCNYRTNMGTIEEGLPPIESKNGAFVPRQAVRPAEFRDGLSFTAVLSEKPRGRPTQTFSPFVGYWINGGFYTTASELVRLCASSPGSSSAFQNDVGNLWIRPYYRFTYYNHIAPPNSGVPDCVGNWDTPDPVLSRGLFSARSYHPGGVNTLFGDGHSSFAKSSIAISTWQAMGTRNSADVIAE